MKKQLFTFVAALASFAAFAQSIPNGGFENWNTSSYESPQYFMCANDEEDRPSGNPPYTVTKTTDAYHGTYAIRLTSTVYNGDSLQAWFANGNPGGSPAEGGIPYAQMPTGVRFYYKLQLAAGDTAIGVAIFKKNGANLATYMWKIGQSQSNYTLFSNTFTPALTQTPDTVVFACASSNLFAHGPYPGSVLTVDSISFTGVSSQPVNFNGSLEQWQTKTRDICLGWNGKASKTTDKYSGTYAVQLTTDPPGFGSDPEVGHINDGISVQGTTLGGYPYSNQIDTIVFYYKYLPANYPLSTDSAEVSACFKLNGSYIGCNGKKLGYAGTYTKVEIPYSLGQAPDTLVLFAQSSLWPAGSSSIGSDLKIDQLYLKSQIVPVSDFTMPATGCLGAPVQLVDNSANGPTAWQWFMTGASPSTSNTQNPAITYSNTGTYTVSVQASNSFGSGSFISKVITIYQNPVVTATSATVCAGTAATLTASGASTYTWSTGATGATLTVSPSASSTYSVTGTSTVGCSNMNTASVFVPTPVTPSICMVTVDSLTDNNIIYWDKTLYTNADSFIVYREVSTGVYSRIGAVSKSATSELKDTMRLIGPANGDPQIGSYRYKLKLRDTCGQYSALSPYHNTVKITDQQNGNFQWNTYDVEGQATPVANFILERDNANNNVWVTVGVVSGTQTSLFDGSYGLYQTIANWRVQATGFNCTPTAKYGNNGVQGAVVKSKSNITNNRTTSVVTNNGIFNVYPNPSSGNVTLSSDKVIGNVVIYNALGTIVFNEKIASTNYTVDLSGQSAGIYMLMMQGKVVKLVKE